MKKHFPSNTIAKIQSQNGKILEWKFHIRKIATNIRTLFPVMVAPLLILIYLILVYLVYLIYAPEYNLCTARGASRVNIYDILTKKKAYASMLRVSNPRRQNECTRPLEQALILSYPQPRHWTSYSAACTDQLWARQLISRKPVWPMARSRPRPRTTWTRSTGRRWPRCTTTHSSTATPSGSSPSSIRTSPPS